MTGMPRRDREEQDADRRQREDMPWLIAIVVIVAVCGGLAFAMMR